MSKRRHRLLGPLRQAPGLTAGLACGVALIAVSACSSGRSGLFDNTPYAGDIEPTIGRPQVAQPPPPVEPAPAPEPTVEAAELPPPAEPAPVAEAPQPAESAVPPQAPITTQALDDAGAPQPAPRITTAPPTVTAPPVTAPPVTAPPAAAPTPTAPTLVTDTPAPPPAATPPVPAPPRAQVATAPPQLILAPPTIADAPRPTTVAEAPPPAPDPVPPAPSPAPSPDVAAPVTPAPVTPAPVPPAPQAPAPSAEAPAGTPAIDRLPRPPTREGFPSLSDVPPRPTDLPTQGELAELQERLERDRAALQAGEVPQRLTPRIPDQPAPAFSGLERSPTLPSAPTPDRAPTVATPPAPPTSPQPADVVRPRTEAPAPPARPAQAAALPTPPAPAVQAVSLPPLALRIPPPPQPVQVAVEPVPERQAAPPAPAIRPAPVAAPTPSTPPPAPPPAPSRPPSATPPATTPASPAPSAPDAPQVAAVAPPQPPAPPATAPTVPAAPQASAPEADQPPVIPGPVETQPLTDFRVDEPEGIPDSQLPADPTERAFLLAFSQSGRTILPDGQVSGTGRLPTLAVLPAAARPAAPAGQFAPPVQPLARPAAPPAQLPPVSQPAVLVQPVTAQPVAFPVSPLPRGNLAATIFFAEGSARLSQRDREVIAAIVEEHRRTGARIHVLGHASRTGDIADPILRGVTNYGESLNRAQAVSAYLSQLGVPVTMMSVDAAGEQLAGSDEIRNRRAEIYLDYAVWQG